MSKAAKMHERETTPVANLLEPEESFRWINEWFAVHSERTGEQGDTSLVKFHQERLGKQTCCWTTYRRYHVWDRPKWRIYVNRDNGVGFEVPLGATSATTAQCWRAFRDYQKALLGRTFEHVHPS